MKALDLIPSYILTKLLNNEELKINKVEKFLLSRRLEFDALKILNEVSAIDITTHEIELDILNTCGKLKVTDEDLECISYGLKPFKADEATEILKQFEFINVIVSFLISKTLYKYYKDKMQIKKRISFIKNLRILCKLNREYHRVCYGKGIKEFYSSLVDDTNYNLKYVVKYINALK